MNDTWEEERWRAKYVRTYVRLGKGGAFLVVC